MFDWTKVDGYREDMTADEKLALLDNYEQPTEPTPQPEPEPKAPNGPVVSKKRFDEVASELAKVKKELKGRLTADETAELEKQTRMTEMETELNELRHEKMVANHRASFLSQGYDDALAEEAANAMADGDTDKVFEVMKRHNANAEKALRAKILKETNVPPAGDDPNTKPDPNKKMVDIMRKAMGLPPQK